jgi:hypothetical protein
MPDRMKRSWCVDEGGFIHGPPDAFAPPSRFLQWRRDSVSSMLRDTTRLDVSLHTAHAAWIDDARRCLEPATRDGADFWSRWAAISYLADEFRCHYRMERSLMDRLRLVLPANTSAALAAQGDRVVRLRLEIDRIGRRGAGEQEFAAGAAALLQGLEEWLAAIERAVALLPNSADEASS